MAESINCNACASIKLIDPSFIVNGLGTSECTSLKNNTGLVASSGHNNETDLNNLNDCLIGNMANELAKYDVCDWKAFDGNLVSNLWNMNKALICAIAGMQTKINALENR